MSTEPCINLGFANRWSPFRQLNQIVSNAVLNKNVNSFELESILTRYKPDILALLKNPPRNALHREIVLNASKDGIMIVQQQNRTKTVIPQILVEEALTLSNMFDLNELYALELLIAGENQECRFPGMTRGPVAVLLYYEGRKSLLSSIQLLVQSRNGRAWSLKLNQEIAKVIDRFTDELKEEGIVIHCIDQLFSLDIVTEYEMLESNRALGTSKYKRQVLNYLKEIRQILGDIIYYYAAQSGLNKNETMKLINLISKKVELDSIGHFDSISTTLIIALLYQLDVNLLYNCEENDPRIYALPLIRQKGLSAEVIRQINNTNFVVPEIKSIFQFAWSIANKTLLSFPFLENEADRDCEKMFDEAVENNLFDALIKLINEHLSNEEFHMRIIHNFICNFIISMPLKVKEMRDKADEIGRIIGVYLTEGLHPPENIPKHFEKLLNFMTLFYSNDKFKLSKEFWPFIEKKEINNRHQSLGKFLRSIVDSFLSNSLHISIIKFLKSLAKSHPFNVFNLIKISGIHHGAQFSIEHFVTLFNQYYKNVFGQVHGPTEISKTALDSRSFGVSSKITNLEIDILCAFLELIETIVKKDRNCCLAIAENHQYSLITTLIGILRCAVTKEIKASILNCLAGFSYSSSSVAFTIWSKMDSILPKPSYTSSIQNQLWQNSIAVEIEDIETKTEEYPITLGFLNLFKSSLIHISSNQSQQNLLIDGCLNFILNSILFKTNTKTFRYEEEKWLIIKACFKIIHTIIIDYEPLVDGANLKGPFNIFTQTLQEDKLFRFITFNLEEIAELTESSFDNPTLEKPLKLMQKTAAYGLKILNCICEKQNHFIQMLHNISGFPLATIVKLDTIFSNVNPRNGLNDRLTTLVRLILQTDSVSIQAINLLTNLVKNNSEIPVHLLMQLQVLNSKHLTESALFNLFVDCIESRVFDLRISTLNLILSCLQCAFGNVQYNFAHKILGFDKKLSINEPGTMGQVYSCFHSILGFFDSNCDVLELISERELGMKIIYTLCISSFTYENVLRFIRSSYDFLTNYLQNWEKIISDEEIERTLVLLSEQTCFLKILTIEIKSTAQQNLKSYCSTYTNFLLMDSRKRFLFSLLTDDVFKHEHPAAPTLEFFEMKEILKAVSECTITENSAIDLKTLHQRLTDEVKTVASQLGVIQTKQVQEEIKFILNYAASLNQSQKLKETKISYFEAWSELVETLIYANALSHFTEEIRSRILLEMIHEMISHSLDQSTISSLLVSLSSIIFASSSALYKIKSIVTSSNLIACIKQITNLLDVSSLTIWNQQKRTRIHLYASLLYLIRTFPYGLGPELKLSPRLLDKLCKDILKGHEIAKVLAILLLIESESSWINDVASDGTLKLIMNSLLTDDREIKANKCELSKVFYTFDAKLMLFNKICSSTNGIQVIFRLDPIQTISSLQCFEIYPFLLNKSFVCHKMFVNIMRFLLVLSTTNNQQSVEEIGNFISLRSGLFNDIIRTALSIKDTKEGKETILIITKIISRFITYASQGLQRNLIGLLTHFFDNIENIEIIHHILHGCFVITCTNALTPLFGPSLYYQPSDMNFGQQSLGIIVLLINNICSNWSDSKLCLNTIEYSLHLLWHHFNLYFELMQLNEEEMNQVEIMKSQTYELFELFSKIQAFDKGNVFIGALIRRMKRLIGMKRK